MNRRERRKCSMGSVVRINKVTFDVHSLLFDERVQRRRISIIKRTE